MMTLRLPTLSARTRTVTARFMAVAVVTVATAGCGAATSRANPFDGSGPQSAGTSAEDPIRIDLQNLNFGDITVWALRRGQRIRLGRVTGKSDETFNIQWNVAIPISFEIDVIGGRGCRTGQVPVERNARIWVAVPSQVGVTPCRAGRS